MEELFVPFIAKVGKPRKFAYPTQMLTAFSEYLEDRKKRSIHMETREYGMVGESDISKTKEVVKHHPLSIVDFCIFLGCSRSWWNNLPDEFLRVKEYITDYLYAYQLKGAKVGEFNANIVARELGLADKKQVDVGGEGVTFVVKDNEQKETLENIGELGI